MLLQPCPSSSPLPLPSSPSIVKFISSHPSLALLHTQCATMRGLRQLHTHLVKTGLARDAIALGRAVAFCAAAGDAVYGARLLAHCPAPNAFMWNTLIRALSNGARPAMAVALFVDMLQCPTARPERHTFPPLFACYARLGRAGDGSQLHGMAVKLGLAADTYVRNAMLAMYASCGRVPEALALFVQCGDVFDVVPYNTMIMGLAKAGRVDESRSLFEEMPSRSVATWSAMISAYARTGRYGEAMELFSAMQEEGLEPNANVLVSILGCCAGLGALDQGCWIHAYIDKHKVDMNPLMVTSLIDMYCKCGRIDKARQVFDTSGSKGLASWNSMMQGLAVHGRLQEALGLFSMLQSCGLKPDKVTFIAILTAYGHSGMADEARGVLATMASEHGIVPEIEHYGCAVDALARAGRLAEAEELIRAMPVRPDAAAWGALLSGCRLHGDAEAGARAARGVAECDPLDSGAYVLLSSTLARGGEFSGGAGARARMREEGVWKEPGCSMIEVNGIAHEFVS